MRGQRLAKDRGRGPVARKDAGGDHPLGRALRTDLVCRLAKRQGLGLRQEVAEEQLVHVLFAILGGVGCVCKGDEVGGNQPCALVDELVERVLAIGAGLAPEDLAGIGGHRGAVPADALAVRLHRELLQVGGEAVQVLVVGENRVARGVEEVDVPHVDEPHQRNDVLLERGVGKVLVQVMEAREELLEPLGAKGDDEREAHRSVHRVAAADPVPEAEHVLGVDAKLRDLLRIGRHGDEVVADGLGHGIVRVVDGTLRLKPGEEPCARLAGVGQRLQRGKRLRDDDDESGLGVEALDLLGHVIGVDVADVTHRDARVRVGLERLVDHDRP